MTDYEGSIRWSPSQVSFIFASLFWGGLLTGVFSGWLADRYGPKNIMLIAVILHVLGSFATPAVPTIWSDSNRAFVGLMIVRFIMGLGQGVTIPCMGSLMSRWFPIAERSRVIAIYTTGNQMAGILANSIGALLCRSNSQLLGGWQAIFYLFGGFGIVWCLFWSLIVSNSPEKNKSISEAELKYLQQELQSQSLLSRKVATKSIPWTAMLRSRPIIAQVFMSLSGACFMTIYQSYLPTYFKQVLHMNISQNGLLSSLPYLVQMTVKFSSASLADRLKRRYTNINHTLLCKCFNSIAAFGTAGALLGVSMVDCNQRTLAVVITCLSFASFGMFAPGFMTSAVCIAPVYTGIVNSITRVFAQISQICGPYIVGFVVQRGTREEWQQVQWILATLLSIGGTVYIVLGSAEIQSWAILSKESQTPLCLVVDTLDDANKADKEKMRNIMIPSNSFS